MGLPSTCTGAINLSSSCTVPQCLQSLALGLISSAQAIHSFITAPKFVCQATGDEDYRQLGVAFDLVLGNGRDGAVRPDAIEDERKDESEGSADDAADEREESEDLHLSELSVRGESESEDHRDDDAHNDSENEEAQKARAAANDNFLL